MATARKFQDFVLELRDYDAADGSYTVAMPPAQPWGDAPAVRLKLDGGDSYKSILSKLDSKKLYIEDLIPFGVWLADHLLPEPIRDRFIAAVQQVGYEGGLRLRLAAQDYRLQQVPWEYAYLPLESGAKESGCFLVLYGHISMVRHQISEAPLPDLQPVDATHLRLLAASASPKSRDFDRLDLEGDQAVIQQFVSHFKVEGVKLDWLPYVKNVTEADLDEALLGKPHFFHFSGHGVYSPTDDSASLVFLKDLQSKAPAYLSSADLAKKLQAAGTRLVVLGACQSGRVLTETPWAAMAPGLNLAGIPAVVAMQFKLLDRKAGPFLYSFYSALAAGLCLDEAVSMARLALWKSEDESTFEWGVPVLYLRSRDGVLFPELAQKETPLAGRLRDAVQINVETNTATGIVRALSIDDLIGPLPPLNLGFDVNIQAKYNAGTIEAIHIGKVRNAGDSDDEE